MYCVPNWRPSCPPGDYTCIREPGRWGQSGGGASPASEFGRYVNLSPDCRSYRLKELPRSLVVVGGGYIALELGQMFRRLGAEVTILERREALLPQAEPDVGPTIAGVLEEEGVQVLLRTSKGAAATAAPWR